MFASELDERERQLGFVRDRVHNCPGFYHGRDEYVHAVVYNVDEENVIVKEICPLGGYRYCHRTKDQSIWRVVSNIESDPQNAIQKAREYISIASRPAEGG